VKVKRLKTAPEKTPPLPAEQFKERDFGGMPIAVREPVGSGIAKVADRTEEALFKYLCDCLPLNRSTSCNIPRRG
jgi:hypothetical protein